MPTTQPRAIPPESAGSQETWPDFRDPPAEPVRDPVSLRDAVDQQSAQTHKMLEHLTHRVDEIEQANTPVLDSISRQVSAVRASLPVAAALDGAWSKARQLFGGIPLGALLRSLGKGRAR